ncbi:hypothetical protein GYA37_00645 [candidate division WWE3 bacterium]|uniref:Glycosyltransferase RgtA/B/C/D-like domain-containing protein n=1 Tax=candidate division WWE3 bacterium TaxID=2053526 RepID=A0A7X9E6G6_UNCKA|nr:hypothetical protein [candidate division WWE3 bacterium]
MSKTVKVLSVLIFIALYLGTRLPRAGTTIVNTDEVYWHDRSERFLNALASKKYVDTFQKYHPGVPLMWEISLTAQLLSMKDHKATIEIFNDFEYLHTNTQLLLIIWFLFLSILLMIFLNKAINNWWLSLLFVVILSLEPFYIGNSRLIHHDAQISLCVIIAIVFTYLTSKKQNIFYIFLASFFLAIGALSKTLFVGAFLFCLFAGALITFLNQGLKKMLVYISCISLGFIFFYTVLFPAIWVAPVETLNKIFMQSYQVGEEEGHTQIFFGRETRTPGFWFYPILLVLKTSPFMILGIVIYIVDVLASLFKKIKDRKFCGVKDISYISFAGIFYLGYFCVIMFFSKKVDRYVVPIYPYLALMATYGWYKLVKKKKFVVFPVALFLTTVVYQLFTLFPHYLMYVNPLVGDAKKANEIIGQKLFGIGVFDLRQKIIDRYGDSMSIGSSDFGPLKSIYPKGVVYNVLVEHPNSFKVMILGPNKELPESIRKDPNIKFKQVDSVYINGLEFWRIYQRNY